jgi:soluble lytic murein transglycosylase-like protein
MTNNSIEMNKVKTSILQLKTLSFASFFLTLCLLVAHFFPGEPEAGGIQSASDPPEPPLLSFDESDFREEYSVSLKSAVVSFSNKKDPALLLYRDDDSRPAVEWFFAHISEDSAVSGAILHYADLNDIPPTLAFALAYTESRYKSRAVHKNGNGTVDRGIFQLNSDSFPSLREDDFFDPNTNARFGMAHLRFCLNSAGNEISALAMYNAGMNRVKNNGAPNNTLSYISNILNYRRTLDELFRQEVVFFFDPADKPMLAYSKAEEE